MAKGDALKAEDIYWNMPLHRVWIHLWCYYQYNGTKVKRILQNANEDKNAVLDDIL